METLKPVAVKRLSDTLLSIDLGQNYTGHVRFRATAVKGTRLVVRHAELLRPDGRLNPRTLRSAQQVDTFLLAGTPDEVVEPRFLHHGLRYAEIEGPIDAIDLDSIAGVVVHTDLETVGTVATSDARINWLLDAVKWTVRGNAMSVMTDVCQRDERRGWLMDGCTGLKAGLLFYDMATLARKWVEDMIDNQEADGNLRGDTAPVWFPCKSIGSTEHLPIVLSEGGRDDLVWQWLQRDAYPGYGFMQRHGATAIWECWEQRIDDGMNAHNHTGLSGIGTWLMQYLVGIRAEPGAEPIFHLRPAVHLPLASLDARWQSRWGEVEIKWGTTDDGKRLAVTIPPGCRGRLALANETVRELGAGRHEMVGEQP